MALAHSPRIVTSGLVLCLDAANAKSYPGSGTTWTDLSVRNNNGTLINGVGFNTSNLGSLSFDGTDDYVDCGNYQFNTTSGTVDFWFKPTTNITGDAAKRAWGFTGNFEARWNSASGRLSFDLGSSSFTVGHLTTTTSSWSNTTWYNVVMTWDSSITASNVYVQGVLESVGNTASSEIFTALTGNLHIARSGTEYFDSNISNFKIYNRALTAAEVSQNFNALRGRFGF